MEKWKEKVWLQLIIIYSRFVIGGSFVFASIIKIKGKRFTTASGEDFPIHSAWHFFETLYQSGMYWQFLGWSQLIAGLLLMTQKYAKIGAIMFLAIISNIFVITISYDFNFTPVITGMMVLAALGLILWDWDTLKVLIGKKVSQPEIKTIEEDKIWIVTGLILFIFTALYRLSFDAYNVLLWFSGCAIVGLASFLLWFKKRGFKL